MDKREKIRVVGYRVDSLILIISVCKGGNYVKRSGKLIFFWYYSILEKQKRTLYLKIPSTDLKKLETML